MSNESKIIHKYLGIPYRHYGRTEDGTDCWGLILLIYKELGYVLWDIQEPYDEKWSWHGKNLFIENYWKEWDKMEMPKLFDVVLFNNGKNIANHAGIYLSYDKFIHCCMNIGVVVSKLYEPQWRKRFNGFYRYKKLKI